MRFIIQQPALAPAWPVVRLSSSPPRPRSSVPKFGIKSYVTHWNAYFTFMNNNSSTNHTCYSTKLHKMILNSDHCNSILTGNNVSKVPDMSVFCTRSTMILTSRVVVTSCSHTVVRQVSFLMNVKPMKSRGEI